MVNGKEEFEVAEILAQKSQGNPAASACMPCA